MMQLNRRQSIGAIAGTLLTSPHLASASEGLDDTDQWIAPPALCRGDKVAFVAPSGPVDARKVELARRVFGARGLEVVMPKSLLGRRMDYLAGSDERRANELNNAIADPDIAGIFPCRGGYGLTRILDKIDYRGLRKQPKIVAGFSDITALHLAIAKMSRVIAFHSPMPQYHLYDDKDFAFVADSFWNTILEANYRGSDGQGYDIEMPTKGLHPRTLAGGKVRGRLVGGNLTLISTTLGTPFQIQARGGLLVLEDVDEEPYRIDRYFSQLRLAGILDQVNGIIIGTLTDSLEKEAEAQSKCQQVFKHYCADLGVPVITDFPLGHTRLNLTIPLGARAELDADKLSLRVLQNPVAV